LISKALPGKEIYGLSLPLITTEKGEKLGKSVGNSVSLDSGPYNLYQFFYNTSDKMSEEYLKLFTFLPLNEIEDLIKEHQVSKVFS
jgi:tyrosyl-tRNA synthetase